MDVYVLSGGFKSNITTLLFDYLPQTLHPFLAEYPSSVSYAVNIVKSTFPASDNMHQVQHCTVGHAGPDALYPHYLLMGTTAAFSLSSTTTAPLLLLFNIIVSSLFGFAVQVHQSVHVNHSKNASRVKYTQPLLISRKNANSLPPFTTFFLFFLHISYRSLKSHDIDKACTQSSAQYDDVPSK